MKTNKIFRLSVVIVYLMFGAINLYAQTNEDCLMCHEDNTLVSEISGKSMYVDANILKQSSHIRVSCVACHKDAAGEVPHESNLKDIDCGSCHATYNEQVKGDIHHKLFSEENAGFPTCKICHGTHNIKVPSSVENKSKQYCGKCHEGDMLSAPYHTKMDVNNNCNECHDKSNHADDLAQSVHGKLACSNCHGYVINNMDIHSENPEKGRLADCYLCHHEIANEHRESIHGLSLSEGINEAAQCWDCHGSHDITKVDDKNSRVLESNLATTCGVCHDDVDFIREHNLSINQPGKMYSTSVHAKAQGDGQQGASCATCHGVHNIKNRVQIGSKISSISLPETCISCHREITEEYKKSIHWIGVKKGVDQSPSCNDCHSEHAIHAINTVDKREEIMRIQEQTCIQCHNNLLLTERYGLDGMVAANYQDSYHGLAVTRGGDNAAMCIDCHGVHNILPAFHEESTISPENIVATCGKCHENATQNFANSYTHKSIVSNKDSKVVDIVTIIYMWLIVIVIGGMILHNLLILFYDIREKYKRQKEHIRIPRMTTNEIIQHLFLLVSFIVLAITGFMLKYPNAFWVKPLLNIGFDEHLRQITHRSAAVVNIALSVYHVIYLVFTRRGRDVLKALLPGKKDIFAAIQNVMFYLRLSKKHPEFDNYNYIEKAEYWALIWGTIVMALTGFILWFPTILGNWGPVWIIKLSEAVHFYEAILATLAILVWHWFFVIFKPSEYPISLTCVDGKMTVKHYKDEHKLKFKNIIVEWLEVEKGIRKQKNISHYTKLFITAIEKQGIKPDEFILQEIEKDEDIKDFVDTHFSLIKWQQRMND